MKTEKYMRGYLYLSWLDNFVYERNNKCNLQNNEVDMEVSEPVEQYITEIDPDIFENVDVQKRSSFVEHNSSCPVSLEPETVNVTLLKSCHRLLKPLGSQNR